MPIIKKRFQIIDSLSNQSREERSFFLWLFILWIFALFLNLIGLGELPLRDFDEATVARVALEISEKTGLEQWLPTIWGGSYLNKPPGIHWLISKLIQLSNKDLNNLPNEFQIRFIPAFLSTLVVPLGGLLQYSLQPKGRLSGISTAAILLTLLPIVRHGRLAMLDGVHLSAMACFWFFLICVDGSSKDKWRFFGAGLASSCMLLIKAPLLLPAALAALIPMFLEHKNKKHIEIKALLWLLIGLIPGFSWHFLNVLNRGSGAVWLWWGDGAGRVLFHPGSGSDLGWKVPIIELFEGGWPWLLLLPVGLIWAFYERNNRWGLWTFSINAILCLSIFPLKTQLPWYSHSLWLPFALLCGKPLSFIIYRVKTIKSPAKNYLYSIPTIWSLLGLILIILGLFGLLGVFRFFEPYVSISLLAGIGWFLGGLMLLNKTKTKRLFGFFFVLLGGYAALLSLMSSQLWLWELNEHWPVKPVANLISNAEVTNIALDEAFERPSLNWYAKQRVQTLQEFPEPKWIVTQNPNSLVGLTKYKECKIFERDQKWSLLSCNF